MVARYCADDHTGAKGPDDGLTHRKCHSTRPGWVFKAQPVRLAGRRPHARRDPTLLYTRRAAGVKHSGTTHYINAGSKVVVQAGANITLNVGDNFIRIDGSGIQIEGTLVKVNCGGSPTGGSPVDPMAVMEPQPYAGPHAERYARSYKK